MTAALESGTVLVTPSRFPDLAVESDILKPLGARLTQAASMADLVAAASAADVLLVTGGSVGTEVIERLERCRAIVRSGVGTDNIDVATATSMGIPVGNVADASTTEVADHAVMLALMLLRRVDGARGSLAEGGWAHGAVRGVQRIEGRVAGVVGLGRIGLAVASRLRAHGMRVIGYDLVDDPDAGVERVGLDDLVRQADLITLHLPLTPATRDLMSAERLAAMKPSAAIVNVSRGGLIDEVALAKALEHGAIWGAGLDVYADEPLPMDSPLRSAPNAVLTPHVAWYSERALWELRAKGAAQAARALRGERLQPTVNAEVYDR